MGRDDDASRFSWHPEPELIGFRDEARLAAGPRAPRRGGLGGLPRLSLPGGPASAGGARHLSRDAPAPLPERRARRPRPRARSLRPRCSTSSGASPPSSTTPITRAPSATSRPPPLLLSIVGELFCQWTNQGVDIWHAGPVGRARGGGGRGLADRPRRLRARELRRADLGRGDGQRDGPDPRARPPSAQARGRPPGSGRGVPRGRALEGVRVYASDQAHFSIARALDFLGFPEETLRIVPSDERFRLHGGAGGGGHPRGPRRGPHPPRHRRRRRLDQHRLHRPHRRARRRGRARGPVAPRRRRLRGRRAALSPRLADRVPALDRADSVTVDPHKWLFQAYDIGGLLVKRRGRPARHLPPRARVLPHEPPRGGAPQLVPVLVRGHAPLPRPQALALLEAPGHRGPRRAWWR